ncbi:type I-E CRISPR-associated protein Cse1/CasA [Streptomyces sp. NPDC004111]|uniref:type I-E CRISPR-associated protein Cse1/CasA n=1 Tax=Streptomyces sp. NPDC004111 TaxID=3364690 RepID=UPI0036ACCA31
MPTATYPTDLSPWIPVHAQDGPAMLGLRALFSRAHRITQLTLPIPPAASGLYRILTAITARLTRLDDPQTPLSAWTRERSRLLTGDSGFDEATVHAYFDSHAWDLFDPCRPFLQDPSLATQCTETAGINTLVYGRPAGNNLAWHSPHNDTAPQPVSCDEALWHLLIHHYYGRSGNVTPRTVGHVKSWKGTAGPLRSTLSFHPLGATLYETLLLHLTPYQGDGDQPPDQCPWERDAPPDPVAPQPPLTWPGRLLTGRSRHAALLVPTEDGSAVADLYLTWAAHHRTAPKLPATDPYLIYDEVAVRPQLPVQQHRHPRKADTARALWRDLDALLLAGDETATTQRPTVFATLNDLPERIAMRLRVQVCGFVQEGQVRDTAWYTAFTPPLWTYAQEHDPAAARRIADARTAAEALAGTLSQAATRAWQDATAPRATTRPRTPRTPSPWARDALERYWPQAETVFWDLVRHPDPHDTQIRPAFARAALAALHAATAPALAQYRSAGPALARATAAVRAAAAPHRPRPKGRRRAQP